jgi:hypothetical protein
MEETRLWHALDTHKESWQATATCMSGLNRIHVRRAKLRGLDAPTKLDVRGLYRTTKCRPRACKNQRVWQSLPVEEQIRRYESLSAARKRLSAPIETTATVTSGPDQRNGDEPDTSEHSEI